MTRQPGVSAIVTAFDRLAQTLNALRTILACDPPPLEVLVHVDGNQTATAAAIATAFPEVRVIQSAANVGPGGGRNRLIAECRGAYVISFDDDSYPIETDYCERVVRLFETYPRAGILAAKLFHRGEQVVPTSGAGPYWCDMFVGAGCAYRRDVFVATTGYVPLPVAYGMEEADLALRVMDLGYGILHTTALRVFHDTDLVHHSDPAVTAGSVANIALLAFLRYPPAYWWLGFAQLASRISWLLRVGRTQGIVTGLASIPKHLYRHRHYRATVSFKCMRRARGLRKSPEPATG